MITLRRLAAAQYKGLLAVDLCFPERGSFLIEGRNEAGKSTLFDAAFFALYGVPLVGDTAAAIHYGAEEAQVRLELSVGGTELRVGRRVRQTAKTLRAEAELEVWRDGEQELVRGQSAVTSRLQQELGGLTDEALLNSCLVAQKQLGRLETLGRSSREQALTVLLNLGKLSEVDERLRLRREDDEALRRARAHVELAGHRQEEEALRSRRTSLLRLRPLVEVREVTQRLRALQESLDQNRASVGELNRSLVKTRERLATIGTLREKLARWHRLGESAKHASSAEQELVQAEEALAAAQQAARALPGKRKKLAGYQEARAAVQALADRQSRLRELAARQDAVAQRLTQRGQVRQRAQRLQAELDVLRRQRRKLQLKLQQLAPLAGDLERSRARLAGLAAIARNAEALEVRRRELEELETSAVQRAEGEARWRREEAAARQALTTLAAQERAREADLARRRLGQARDCLREWVALREQAEAARRARRLLDDLALGVAGVERVSSQSGNSAAVADGLRLTLVLDHPLTGARQLRLRLWADGAELVESRPATTDETRGLKAGGLPTLSAAADGTLKAELERAADTLAALGERVPRDVPAAANRLAEIDGQLAKPAIAYEEEAYVRARSDATAADALLNQATADLGKLPPVVVLKQQIEAAHADVTSLEDELRQLAARWQLAAPDLGAIPAAAVLASEEEQRRSTHLAGELGQRDGVQGQLDELDRSERERESELAECQQNLAVDTDERLMEEQRLLTEQRAALQADAEGLAIAVARTFAGASSEDAGVLLGEAQRLCDEASVEVASLEQKASELDGATQRLASAQDGRAALREKMVAELDGLAVELGTVGTVSLPSSAAEIHALATDRLASLGQELERLDEAGARAAEQEAQRTLGAAEGAVGRALDDARSLAERAIEAATQLGHSVPLPEKAEAAEPAAVADSLLQACPDAAAELPTHAEIEEQLGTLEQQVGRLEQARQQARATLGDEPPMPLDAAQTALRTLELDLKARERAREIVGVTRQRMINKVVPDTIHNMCLLLPLLTAGRYRYAELTPDYRLQVWDERKHGYVEKNLYSGGTQDQFSLALRLGFALAALPRELGTSPGFLFLDEPLSSFDQDRTAALVDLLTLGHVGTFFQQVFLISHSQAFDRALFTHHVLMEEGQVVESTFPGPAAQATGGE